MSAPTLYRRALLGTKLPDPGNPPVLGWPAVVGNDPPLGDYFDASAGAPYTILVAYVPGAFNFTVPNSGGTGTWSISGANPYLTINATTGVITSDSSGDFNAAYSSTVTCTNAGGSSSITFAMSGAT